MSEASAQPPLVLVVAHRSEVRTLLSGYVLSRGLVPVPAAGRAHADAICQTLAPDVLLIDLPLPDTDVVALIERIRARRPGAGSVVCMESDEARAAQYRAEGIETILLKPLDVELLDRALAELTARARRR